MKEAAAEDSAVPIPEGIHFVKSVNCILTEVSIPQNQDADLVSEPNRIGELAINYDYQLITEIFHPPGPSADRSFLS